MRRQLFLAFIFIQLFSCGDSNVAEELYSINSKIIFEQPQPAILSDIAESVDLLRLETRDDVLIGMYPQVKIVDSLVVVYSHENGVFIFDSQTGQFKQKIPGFKDRGPLGYSGSDAPMVLNEASKKLILHKWDRLGVWDYTIGRMLNHTLPLNPLKYQRMFFLNDTLLVGDMTNIGPDTKSTLNAISYRDGRVVREYGFMEKTDSNPNITSFVRTAMSEYANYINYTHFVYDYIYGIDKNTLSIEPRYALDLGRHLKSNVVPVTGETEAFIAVSSMCETDRYLFLQFSEVAKDTWHFVYYDKTTRETFYTDSHNYLHDEGDDYGFVDNLSGGVSFFPYLATSDGRVYRVKQAVDMVAELGEERAAELGIAETDNPVIVIAKLKK
jgi:hypothetical protein